MMHADLVAAVSLHLSPRFSPSAALIKNRIEVLIDREYIQRGPGDMYNIAAAVAAAVADAAAVVAAAAADAASAVIGAAAAALSSLLVCIPLSSADAAVLCSC